MVRVRQAVDHRDRSMVGQFRHGLLGEGPHHQSFHVPGQHPGDLGHGFVPGHLGLARGQVYAHAPQ